MTYKEKKKLLTSFSDTEKRLRELEEELEELWNGMTGASQRISGIPKTKKGANAIEIAVERREKLVRVIDSERDELETIKYRIMTAVRELPSITERRIIHLKYIGKVSGQYHRTVPLWRIANELGYSVDRIKQLHKEAIIKLKL